MKDPTPVINGDKIFKMAAKGRSGLLGSTHGLCILQFLLLLLFAWTYNFFPYNKDNLVNTFDREQMKL
ncbi:MAG: hypothetical protein ACRCZO_14695, partial [Cetobacterium sp.]